MRIEKCYFCSRPIYPGHGRVFVRNDCKALRFCRSKCFSNFKLRRNPRKTRWTKAFRKANGKELAVDSTFEFEKKRNRPIKYDRELMQQTLYAMKRVGEIQDIRKARFQMSRKLLANKKKRADSIREIKQGIDLIIAPIARQRQGLDIDQVIKMRRTVESKKMDE